MKRPRCHCRCRSISFRTQLSKESAALNRESDQTRWIVRARLHSCYTTPTSTSTCNDFVFISSSARFSIVVVVTILYYYFCCTFNLSLRWQKKIYVYWTSSLLALRTFNCKFQLFNSAFNAFSAFCVAFSQLRVLHATSSLKRLSLVASALFSGQRLPAVCGSSQATAQLICSTGLWRRRLFSRHTHSHGWLADCFVIVAGAAAANA